MPHVSAAAADVRPAAFPVIAPGSPVPAGMGFRQPALRHRWLFWPAEFLRAVGVAFLFPLVILAVVIPLGLALKGLITGGGWLWNAIW